MYDTNETAQKIKDFTETLLAENWPAGVAISGEFCLGDVTGKPGRSLKFNLRSHQWCDFANPEHKGSGIVSLYAAKYGIEYRAAFRELAERIGRPFQPKTIKKGKSMKKNDGKLGWIPTVAPWHTKLPEFDHPKFGHPTQIYNYYAPEGRYGFICRYETPEGKEIRPIVFAKDPMNENRHEWRWQQMAQPRPLYNLLRITERPSDFAVIVEGEKAADALADSIWPVTTWSGGSCAWKKTDFSPIYGRKVVLWPDNDEPGIKCMEEIAEILERNGSSCAILDVSALETAADCADIENPLQFFVDNAPTWAVESLKNDLILNA